MDSICMGQIPGAQRARLLSTLAGGNDQPVEDAIADAIIAAIDSGLFTCTVACSAFSAQNIQAWMNMLNGLSYTTSYAGSTLTISW